MMATPTVLGLTEDQLHFFQKTFRLSYHLNYLQVCQQFVSFRGLDVLEVGGSLPASLVIDHLGCNSWSSVEAPSYDQELGLANQFHRNSEDKEFQEKHSANYKHFYFDVEETPEEHYGKYDLIFSIACFEHINRLPQALRIMHRCLKPGGCLFTMHSPIWSAYDGHHLPIGIPERFELSDHSQAHIFSPWEHLLSTRSQVFRSISQRFDSSFAEEIVYYTYNSNHINRYFTEDYKLFFEESPFDIEQFQLTFPSRMPENIENLLKQRYPGHNNFANNGILALLRNNCEIKNKIFVV